MKVTIEVANNVRRNKGIRGSLFIDDDSQANFRPDKERASSGYRRYKKLRHGRVTVNEKATLLRLSVSHEERVDALSAIKEDCKDAREWLIDDYIINN